MLDRSEFQMDLCWLVTMSRDVNLVGKQGGLPVMATTIIDMHNVQILEDKQEDGTM